MNNSNVVPISSLDKLATDIREADARRQKGRSDWIEGTLIIGARMREARNRLGNVPFRMWLAKEDLMIFNKNDQAAILEMAAEPDIFRLALEESTSVSLQGIRDKIFRSLPNVRKTPENLPADPPESPPAVVTNIFATASHEPATGDEEAEEPEVVTRKGSRGRGKKGSTKGKGKGKGKRPANSKTRLRDEHGEAGAFLDAWLATGLDPERQAPNFAGYWLGNMPREVVEEIALFVRAHPELPLPHPGPKDPTPRLFWERMPQQLQYRLERSVPLVEGEPDGAKLMLATIDEWDKTIGPALAAWVAAGKPYDTRAWYHRYISGLVATTVPVAVPVVVQAVPATPDLLVSIPAHMRELLDEDRPYENVHQGFQPSREGPIRAHGVPLWPRPASARWTFRDAFYAWHLWNELQPLMKDPRPVERARALMNPIQPILANCHGGMAAALRVILVAQFQNPDNLDTVAPPKRLNFES